MEKNLYPNIDHLKPADQVKFVICSREDYQWSLEVLDEWNLSDRCEVLFSPALGRLGATELADWIVRDQVPVRFQIQLHKYLWGDQAGK